VSVDKLRAHFGFTKTPFSKNIPPSALHPHRGHQEAVARIDFLVEEVAIGVVTGEVGSGKTVAARAAISALEPARHTVIYLPNPAIGTRGLYTEIVSRLGGEPRYLKAGLIAQATGLLAAEAAERGRRIVIACDEAHLLDSSQLDALRLLTSSVEMDSENPFALILLGQPMLRARLRLGAFAALDQRITLRYAIPPMSREESASYLVHHLRLAGRSDTLFSEDAVQRIHEAARGLPRALNNLARQALVAAYTNRTSIVDEKAARQAVAECEAD
jgi:type II secretory pathway predicted ATPase ExeA